MLDQQQIEALEERRRTAMVAEDVKTLETLLDDSLVWVHGSAKKDSKASFLAGFGGSGPKYLEFQLSDVVIRCAGEFAIVNGIQKLRCTIQGTEFNRSTRFVNVWSAHDGKPRMMTWQSTPMPEA